MLVISENLVWRPVVHDRHCTPATADFGHLLQQRSPTGLTSNPTQSLLEGASSRRCDALAGQLRQIPGQALGFGVFNAQRHGRFLGSLLGTFYLAFMQEAVGFNTRALWVVLRGGNKQLYLERRTVHLTAFAGADESVDRTEVPKDIEPFVIAKTQQEFGKVETVVSLPELMRIAAEKEAERSKPIVSQSTSRL
jgi:hypothetical protein